jgi:hypothetical protein
LPLIVGRFWLHQLMTGPGPGESGNIAENAEKREGAEET